MKKVSRVGRFPIAALLFGLLLVGACVPLPQDASWGHMSLIGDPQQIMFAFHDRIVLIDPIDGSLSELRDADGNVRVDEQGSPRPWRVQAAGNQPMRFYSSPIALDDNTLLAAAYDRRLFEIDLPAARLLTTEGTAVAGQVVADMATNGDMIYIPLSEGGLVAVNDAAPADVVWRFTSDHGVWTKPLLVEDTLYVSGMDHFLYALNATTGEERWRIDLGGAVASTPVLHDDHLYVGSFARKLFKIRLDGSIAAEYSVNEWVWGSPAIVDNTLYIGDAGGWVYALSVNADSFEPVWTRQVASRTVRGTPLVTEEYVIVGSRDQNVYWVSRATGEELIRRNVEAEILADLLLLEPSESLNIPEPMVIVSTMAYDKLLFAFTVDNGELRWRYAQ